MFIPIAHPVRLHSRCTPPGQAERHAILFTDEPQLPFLIGSVLAVGGINLSLSSAPPAAVYGVRAAIPSPDTAILDLPFEVDEVEVGNRISVLRQAFPRLRVLLLSGCSFDKNMAARLPHEDVWFLLKPFRIPVLTGVFHEILYEGGGGRQGAARQGKSRFGSSEGESRTSSMTS